MENIIEKLQKEVGLTKDQAEKSLLVIKDFMNDQDLSVDWEHFAKKKAGDLKDSVSSFFDKASDKARDLGDKISDTFENITHKTKDKVEEVKSKTVDKAEEAKDKTEDAVKSVKKDIEEKL